MQRKFFGKYAYKGVVIFLSDDLRIDFSIIEKFLFNIV